MSRYTTDYDPLYRFSTASIPLTGTEMALGYNCRRVLGRDAGRQLEVPLTGDDVPAWLNGVDVAVEVAGYVDETTYDDPEPNLAHEFTWDGRTNDGTLVHGSHPVDVTVEFSWQGNYGVPEETVRAFAQTADDTYQEIQSRATGATQAQIEGRLEDLFLTVLDYRRVGFGGWSLIGNHRYDSTRGVLYRGDGSSRTVRTSVLRPMISVAAGKDPDERLRRPAGVTLTADEAVLVADKPNGAVREFRQSGASTTLVGYNNAGAARSSEELPRSRAEFSEPVCAREGPNGGVYVSDKQQDAVYRIGPGDGVERVVGDPQQEGFQTEPVVTETALLDGPTGLAFDEDGALLVAEANNHVVRRVVPGGETTVVAGTGESGYDGDGGPATEATFSNPAWLATGPDGGVYVADKDNHAVRRFEVGGEIETVAGGNGSSGGRDNGDGGPAVDARLENPLGVDVTADGELYVTCDTTHTVRRVAPDGTIETVAGGNGAGYTGNGGPAVDAQLQNPYGVVAGEDGSVYVSEWGNDVVRRITPDGTIEVFNGWLPGDERSGADERTLGDDDTFAMRTIAVAPDDTIYYAGQFENGAGIRRVTPDGTIERVAGENGYDTGVTVDGGPATEASFQEIVDMTYANGSLYVVDKNSHIVREIDDGQISTVAGSGEYSRDGVDGDGGPATEADLTSPVSVAASPSGDLYIVEFGHRAVRRVDPSGTITTYYDGSVDFAETFRTLQNHPRPGTVGLDADENVYLLCRAPGFGHVVLTERSDGTFRYVTGQVRPEDTRAHRQGDVAPRFPPPRDLVIAADGTAFLPTESNVYRATVDDTVSRVAGVGVPTFVGDEGPAKQAGLVRPQSAAMGSGGQLYVGGGYDDVVRRLEVRLDGEASRIVPNREGTEFYEFDSAGYHLRTFDAETGAVVRTFSYDDAGLLTETTDVDGETTRIERDDAGNPTAVVAPNGQRTALSVDADGYLTSAEAPGGHTTSLSYGTDGLLTTYEAPSGRTVEFAYDDDGKLDSVTSAAGTLALSESESDGTRVVTEESPLGRTTTHRVEHGADVVRTTAYPSGATGRLVGKQRGGTTRTYRSGDEVDQDPPRPDPRFGEGASYPGTERRRTPGGTGTTVEVRRSARMASDGDPRTVERVVGTESVGGRTRRYVFDSGARERTTTTPEGRSERAETDAAGRYERIDHDGLATETRTYDDTGRLTSVEWGTGDDARRYAFSFDDGGHLTSATDAVGESLSFSRDAAGYVESTTLPGGRTVGFDNTAEGLLAAVTSPGGSTYEFAYDDAGRLAAITLPDGSTVDFAVTADDQLDAVTYPDGSTASYSYDDGGRTESVDLGYGVVEFSWDDRDMPSRLDGPDGVTLDYEFDGSLLTERTWSGPVSGTVERTYDDGFRLAERTVAGTTVSFDYDDDDLRTRAGDLDIVRNDDTGLVDETTLGSTTETWTHTEYGTVDTHAVTAGGATLYDADYTYDARGLVTTLEETVDGTTTTREFEYDASWRLLRVVTDGETTQTFGYDDDDNRTSHTLDGTTVSPTYDDRNRLREYGTRSYEYDGAGRLERVTEDGDTTTYDYDVEHNLRSVTTADGTTIEYLQDGIGRRVAKRVDGEITRKWLYRDGLSPVAELDGDDTLVAQFVYGTRDYVPDYVIRDGTRYRIVTDHLGSPRLVVDASSGAIEQRIDYDAFGRVTRDTNPGFQPFGFAGGLYDPDTDLVRHGARDYDPRTGRWTTPDPLYVSGGSYNLYTYAANAPQNVVDREGLLGPPAAGFMIGGGSDFLIQAHQKGVSNVDLRQTAVAAGVGAATGGLGNAVTGSGLSLGANALRSAGVGALGGAAEHGLKKKVTGDCVTWDGLGKAAAIGGATGGAGSGAKRKLADYGDQIRHYNDVAQEAGEISRRQAVKPTVLQEGGDVGVDVAGKFAGAGISSATSSPGGASK